MAYRKQKAVGDLNLVIYFQLYKVLSNVVLMSQSWFSSIHDPGFWSEILSRRLREKAIWTESLQALVCSALKIVYLTGNPYNHKPCSHTFVERAGHVKLVKSSVED